MGRERGIEARCTDHNVDFMLDTRFIHDAGLGQSNCRLSHDFNIAFSQRLQIARSRSHPSTTKGKLRNHFRGETVVMVQLLRHDVCNKIPRHFLIFAFQVHLGISEANPEEHVEMTYQSEAFVELALNIAAILGVQFGVFVEFFDLLRGVCSNQHI